jgi:molybdopterin biosynthesis enzyme
MTPASGVKRYHSEVVPLQNVPRAIKSSPDNQEYLRGQRVYHCGGNYQLTPYSESVREQCTSLQTQQPWVVRAHNKNRITPTDNVKKGTQLAWKVACGRFAYYLVLPGINRRYY